MLTNMVLASLLGALPGVKLDALQNPAGGEANRAVPVPSSLTRGDFGPCAVTIDFDDVAGGGIGCDGTHITTQYPGLEFDVPSGDCVVCANNVLGGAIPTNSDPNVAFVQQNTNVCSDDALPGTVTFATPVTMVGMDFFTSLNSDFTLRTFDTGGLPLDAVTLVGTPTGGFGLGGFAGLAAAGPLIARIEFLSRSFTVTQPFNFSVDDFVYQLCSGCSLRAPAPPRAARSSSSEPGLCP